MQICTQNFCMQANSSRIDFYPTEKAHPCGYGAVRYNHHSRWITIYRRMDGAFVYGWVWIIIWLLACKFSCKILGANLYAKILHAKLVSMQVPWKMFKMMFYWCYMDNCTDDESVSDNFLETKFSMQIFFTQQLSVQHFPIRIYFNFLLLFSLFQYTKTLNLNVRFLNIWNFE